MIRDEQDRWFETDIEATEILRNELDRKGGSHIPVVYPLALSYALMRNQSQRQYRVEELKRSPIDSLWLQIDGFGASSTGAAVRTFLDTAADFHHQGKPIVADRTGGLVGLSLLAFGSAVYRMARRRERVSIVRIGAGLEVPIRLALRIAFICRNSICN